MDWKQWLVTLIWNFRRCFVCVGRVFKSFRIEPYVATDVFQGSRSSGSSITSTTKLAVTLRWLAGGAYQDIASLFGVSIMNFFHPRGPLWTTIDAIDKAIKLGFSLKQENLRQTASEFSRYSHGRLKDCVMAIDGWVCKTRQPSVKEVGISTVHWRNRKKMFCYCCTGRM
jgi:hypothetical protein